MCGILGMVGHPQAKNIFPILLRSLEHRGHDSAGIAGFRSNVEPFSCIEVFKGCGKASSIIKPNIMDIFYTNTLIGHTRYSTRNKYNSNYEIHPHIAQSLYGKLAIVTNGDLINIDALLNRIKNVSVKIYSKNDAAIVASLINIEIRKNGRKIFQAIKETMNIIKGGYASLLLMEDDNRLFAFRDPNGIRPLYIGEFIMADKKCVVFSSETCSFDIIQRHTQIYWPSTKVSFTYREVKPGEIIAVDVDAEIESSLNDNHLNNIGCVFETIYFSRPDSKQRNISFQVLREQMGSELFNESPAEADIVVAVPKGGIPSAIGYSKASKIPYCIGILEEPTIGGARSFITNDKDRLALAAIKYNILPDIIKGKRIVLVDDSIVRGTTVKILIKNLFQAGAKEIHLRIPCPPYNYSCHYGIETKNPESLISHQKNTKDICKQLNATSLEYLSISGLYKSIGQNRNLFCDECLSNKSPF